MIIWSGVSYIRWPGKCYININKLTTLRAHDYMEWSIVYSLAGKMLEKQYKRALAL